MKRSVLIFLCLATPALAATAPKYDLFVSKPLTEVFTHLDQSAKKLKNPTAHALKKAYDALQKKQYAKARTLAKPGLTDGLFSDYAHWITATAFQEEAEKQADGKHSKEAGALAAQGLEHFRAVQTGSPYSPMAKPALKALGDAEVLVAYGLKPGKEAVEHFESAFELLTMNNGGVGLLPPEMAVSFAKGCAKASNELCEPWLFRLTEKMDHESDEFKAIAKLIPSIETRSKTTNYASHATQPYHAPDLDFTAFDDAMAATLAGHWSEAKVKLTKFLDEFPKSVYRFRARYWLARANSESRQKDESLKEWASILDDSPMSYYGIISAIGAGAPFDSKIGSVYPIAAERDPSLSASEVYHLKRSEILIAEKANDLAGMDLKEIRPRAVMSSPFVAYLAALNYRAENFPMLMTVLTELIQRNYEGFASEIGLKMIFPISQFDLIKKYAVENGVDPVLVISLIKQESAFDLRAMSGSGAAGLMQIMYFTALETVPGISRTDLLEPEHNIRVGTRYLAQLMKRFHGNIVLSLAGYNAGPNAAERWAREGSKQKYGMLPFIESIPYRETRDYVSSIIRNYFWYSKILKAPQPTSLSFFWKPHGDLPGEIGGPDMKAPPAEPSPLPSPSPTPTPTAPTKSSSPPSASPSPSGSPSASPTYGPSLVPSPSPSRSKNML